MKAVARPTLQKNFLARAPRNAPVRGEKEQPACRRRHKSFVIIRGGGCGIRGYALCKPKKMGGRPREVNWGRVKMIGGVRAKENSQNHVSSGGGTPLPGPEKKGGESFIEAGKEKEGRAGGAVNRHQVEGPSSRGLHARSGKRSDRGKNIFTCRPQRPLNLALLQDPTPKVQHRD